jgi:glycosyltransferase involved in cell wall biosynthesis
MTARLRALMIATHPVQYQSPVFRAMANDPRLDIKVAYCSLLGAQKALDREFGVEVQWDVPLLDGYTWAELPNTARRPGLGHFWGLCNLRLWSMIRKGRFDAVVAYTGYAYASFWIALLAAKSSLTPFIFGTDATSLDPRSRQNWRVSVKKRLLPRVFRLASAVIVPSIAGADFIRHLNIPGERIFMTPFVVDNDWWIHKTALVNRSAVRDKWGIPREALVAVFCAKLQDWKRPLDALTAFARANVPETYLIFAGEGPQRAMLEAEAQRLEAGHRVRFLGFVNQSALPEVYGGADLLVLPSEYDPCPAVVPEAMLCGCPAAISDQIRGRFDLVENGKTGFIFPCGNIEALAEIMKRAFSDGSCLTAMKLAARKRMDKWTVQDNVDAIVATLEFTQTQKNQAVKKPAGQ